MSPALSATSGSSPPVAVSDLERLRDEVKRLSDDKYQRPSVGEVDRNCDLTMKGGTTSGVVYPLAVCELALRYRFRNIGGASAGAIAAVAAAAAEHGQELDETSLDAARQRSRQLQCDQPDRGHVLPGFAGLAQIPLWLIESNHLLKLFQPSQGTRPLFNVMLAIIGRKPFAAVWRAVLATGRPARWLLVLMPPLPC